MKRNFTCILKERDIDVRSFITALAIRIKESGVKRAQKK